LHLLLTRISPINLKVKPTNSPILRFHPSTILRRYFDCPISILYIFGSLNENDLAASSFVDPSINLRSSFDSRRRQEKAKNSQFPLPNSFFRVYNPVHETNLQALRNRSSRRRYASVLGTCHGLRLDEETQVPKPTGSGLFYFPRPSTLDFRPSQFHPSQFILHPFPLGIIRQSSSNFGAFS
jgi:hypothetical protein